MLNRFYTQPFFTVFFRPDNSAEKMLARRLLGSCLRHGSSKMQVASMSSEFTAKVGNREVVGYGANGEASYFDHHVFPMPAVRFKEVTPDIQALKEKEKGDWKKLTIEEKKALYRASFCQTFAEMDAPTGEWKSILGTTFLMISVALWAYVGLKIFVYEPLPESFSEEAQLAQLERMRILDVNPITGINRRK